MENPTLPISDVTDAPLDRGPSLADRFNQFKSEVAQQAAEPAAPAAEPAAPAPELAPPAPAPAEPASTDTEPASPQPAAKLKWGELKQKATRADELEKTLAEKEQELATFRQRNEELAKNDPTLYEKQIAEKEKAIADYEKRLAVIDVRESRLFKETIEAPLRKIAAKTANLAQMYKINPVDLQQAIQIEDPAERLARINDLTADFDPIHKGQVWTMAEESIEHLTKAWEMHQNATEAKKELDFIQAEEKKKEAAAQEQRLNMSVEAVKAQFLEKVPILKERPELAQKVFAARPSTDPGLSVYNAMAGILAAELAKEVNVQGATIKKLEAELAKRASLSPQAGGSNGSTQHSSAPPSEPVTEGSAWQRARAWQISKT